MSHLRPLNETLFDIADGAMAQALSSDAASPLRITTLEMSVPLDIRLAPETEVLEADFPLFRRRTAFDPEPARLTITLAEASP